VFVAPKTAADAGEHREPDHDDVGVFADDERL
jgi:hypothetical protein